LKNIIDLVRRLLGSEAVEAVLRGEPVRDSDAWLILDHILREKHRVLYEDEEVNEHECYIIVVELPRRILYILLKINSKSYGYFTYGWKKELFNTLYEKYRECCNG